MMMTLAQAHALLPGAHAGRRRRDRDRRACTATPARLQPGDLFVALRGERFDAHDFLAAGAGRAARPRRSPNAGSTRPGLPGLLVADTRPALQQLAARLARALRAAADRGDRQQRQDHGDADDRVHPARLASATTRWRPPAT